MAVEGGEPEYVSDPEDAVLPSVRRRAASDEEEEEDEEDRVAGSGRPGPADRRGGGVDSEGEGGAPYDDEEYEEYYEEEEEYGEDDLLVEDEEVEVEGEGRYEGGVDGKEGGVDGEGKAELESGMDRDKEKEREREKEIEPFVVPKAGPFYMHDDRFRENRGFRGRRMPGGHKLWDSKDERAWMHDKFEEMNLEDIAVEQGRNYRGRYRGRGKPRGRGYGRGRKDYAYENKYRGHDDRSRVYGDRSWTYDDRPRNTSERSRAYSDGIKNRMPKVLRGRGPRRYEPLMRNRETSPSQKQMVEVREPTSKTTTGNQPSNSSNQQSGSVPPQKQVFTSSLNSASPPFYPSATSNQDYSVISKRDIQTGNTTRNVPASMFEENAGSSKGKTVGYVGHDKFLVDNSFQRVPAKNIDDMQLQWSPPSLVNTSQSTQPRTSGRDFHVAGQSSYHRDSSPTKTMKSSTMQPPPIQQRPVQAQVQPVLKTQLLNTGIVMPSPSPIHSKNASELDASENVTSSNKSKTLPAAKEKVNNSQSAVSASFLYGGAPIIGANGQMGLPHGTQGFAGTPALLPVMQFCGQNPAGLRVPTVGLALPGYVAQSQPGLGNSEMTWMPALASAGALGASYGQYFAIDSSYYTRPSSQVSSTSRDGSTNQSVKPSKSPQSSATANDEAVQRQNKPRRYSEMSFGQ